MNLELTPEQIKRAGQLFGKSYLSNLSPEERLEGINPRDVMSHFGQMEQLQGLSLEEIEAFENKLSELKKRIK